LIIFFFRVQGGTVLRFTIPWRESEFIMEVSLIFWLSTGNQKIQ